MSMTHVARPLAGAVKRGAIRALACCVVAALLPSAASAQVTVDQLELYLSASPTAGALAPRVFTVSNPGPTPTQVTIRAEDWYRGEDGENRYATLGSLPTTCGSHVQVFPAVLQLPANSSQQVRVSVDSAGPTRTGCYTILFIETPKPPRATQTGAALQYSLRYGLKVHVEPDGPVAGEVTDVALQPAADGTGRPEMLIGYVNTGARQTIARGSVQVRRPDNSVALVIPIPDFPVLPGARRRLRLPLPEMPAGKYVLLALIDYGGDQIAAGQVEW